MQRLKPLGPQHIAPLARTEGVASTSEQREPAGKPPQERPASPNTHASAGAQTQFPLVAVKSMPEAADINVDGKFVGSTPSTIQMPPGEHTISIQKSGFKRWQRTVTVGQAGSITIDATLQNE